MSLAILKSDTAKVRSVPETAPARHGALHRELVGRAHERQAAQLGDLGRRRLGEAGALMPVPTAVPPSASW